MIKKECLSSKKKNMENFVTLTIGMNNMYKCCYKCEIMSCYHISSVIRQSFFSFQNNPKSLDASHMMDLDLWGILGRVKVVL